MKKRKRRQKRHQPLNLRKKPQLSEAHLLDIIKASATAFEMFEEGLRPMPLEIEDPLEPQTFTGDTWETSWHFADQLLLLSMTADVAKVPIKFDILTDDHEFATTLADIPILTHLALEVTPIDTLPDDIPDVRQMWRVHSSDFQEHPEDTFQILFLSGEVDIDDGEQNHEQE